MITDSNEAPLLPLMPKTKAMRDMNPEEFQNWCMSIRAHRQSVLPPVEELEPPKAKTSRKKTVEVDTNPDNQSNMIETETTLSPKERAKILKAKMEETFFDMEEEE